MPALKTLLNILFKKVRELADKRAPCRFTLQFNPGDPVQQQCIAFLNSQGRRKASVIANAVIQYIGGEAAVQEQARGTYDRSAIKQIVKEILAKQEQLKESAVPPEEVPTKKKLPPKPSAIVVRKEDLDQEIPDDMLDSITQFVSDFRK